MGLLEITKWNYKRNKLALDVELEKAMLLEEELEFKDALLEYLDDSQLPQFSLDAVVDMVDAYCDYSFVYTGSVAKSLGTEAWFKDCEERMKFMNSYIIEALLEHKVQVMDITTGKSVIDEAMQYVIDANNAKPVKKTKGKVAKGSDWVDPKEKIKESLLTRGWQDEAISLADQRKEAEEAVLAGTLEDFQETYEVKEGDDMEAIKDA